MEVIYLVISNRPFDGLPHYMEVGSIVLGTYIEVDPEYGYCVRVSDSNGKVQWVQEVDLFKIGWL